MKISKLIFVAIFAVDHYEGDSNELSKHTRVILKALYSASKKNRKQKKSINVCFRLIKVRSFLSPSGKMKLVNYFTFAIGITTLDFIRNLKGS